MPREVLAASCGARLGILISLALLSIPTALLAIAPDLTTFTALRVAQGSRPPAYSEEPTTVNAQA